MARDVVRWMRFARASDGSVGFGIARPVERRDRGPRGRHVRNSDADGRTVRVRRCGRAAAVPALEDRRVVEQPRSGRHQERLGVGRPSRSTSSSPRPRASGTARRSCRRRRTPAASSTRASSAIVIGTACADVDLADVDEVIFGYTCVNDVTAFEIITEDESFPAVVPRQELRHVRADRPGHRHAASTPTGSRCRHGSAARCARTTRSATCSSRRGSSSASSRVT